MAYEWLADKKKEAMMAKLQRRGLPNYRQLPLRERYGVSYTGYGPDGKLNPAALAGMGNGGVYHEGETKADLPEGSVYLDANTTEMMPQTAQEQAQMELFARRGNLPGFQSGGFFPKVAGIVKSQAQEVARNVLPGQEQKLVNQPSVVKPQIEAPKFGQAVSGQTQGPQQVVSEKPEISAPVFAQPTQPQVQQPTQPIVTKPQGQAPVVLPVEETPAEETPEEVQKKLDQRSKQINEAMLAGRQQVIPATETTVTPTTETTKKTTEETARETGMQWFLDALNKENPALLTEGRRAADELALRQQQERSALEQQLAQEGVDLGRARVESQMLRDKQETELNDLAAQYGIEGMKARQEIAGTLATQGLAGEQFEVERQKYKEDEDWKAYEAAIAAGDFDTAAQAYKKVTGNAISMDQMKTYQNYLNTIHGQEITAGDLANDASRLGLSTARMQSVINDINNGVPLATINSTYGTNLTQSDYDSIGANYSLAVQSLKTKVGDEKWASIQDRINSGASLEQVNKEFGTNLTSTEFQSMLDATPLGERNWGRQVTAAGLLLQAGGEANITKAATMYNEIFPGLGIDFSKAITEDKAATFGNGMAQLSSYVAAGMDYDEAIAAMKKDGTFEMLGMTDADVEKLYKGMKTNAIDEEWENISESDWFKKTLTDEERADMEAFFTAVTKGELDYKVQKEYTVTAKDGTTTKMYFNTKAEADAYAADNKATVTATGGHKIVANKIETEEEEETEKTTNKPQGTVYLEDGKVWKVGTEGKAVEFDFDVTDSDLIWNDDADAVIKAGREGNPLYDQLIENRVSDMIENQNFDKLKGVQNTDSLYLETLKKMPMYDSKKEGWEVGQVKKVKLPDGTEVLLTLDYKKTFDDERQMQLKTMDGKKTYYMYMDTKTNNYTIQ